MATKRHKRHKSENARLCLLCLFVGIFCGGKLYGQKKLEAGIQLTGVHLHKLDKTPIGIGGRFSYNFSGNVALDTELTRYSDESAILAGIKAGIRPRRFGVFGKGRVGMWRFGGAFFEHGLDRKNIFALDLGGVLEYYPSARIVIRMDIGDTILDYGRPDRLGTVHNFQPGIGLSFRF